MRAWWPFLLVALAWLGACAVFQYAAPGTLFDPDEYFHLQMAVWMQEHGWRLTSFPVATDSIWVDGFFDKDWLFHLFLLPFLSLGKIAGAKLAVLTLNAALLVAFWLACRAVGSDQPARWVVLLPFAAGWTVWTHLQLCRPHLLGLVFLCLAIAALWRRRDFWLVLVAALWALGHASHWMLPFMVLAYDALDLLVDEQGRWAPHRPRRLPLLVPALTGLAVGTLLHPQFPRNVSGLFVQNVLTLGSYWQQQAALADFRPRELEPLGVQMLVLLALPVVVGLALLGWRLVDDRRRPASAGLYWLLLCTVGFAVLAVLSLRFLDYLAPCGVLLLAAACARLPAASYFAMPLPRLLAGMCLAALITRMGVWQLGLLIAAATALCTWAPKGRLTAWLSTRLVPLALAGLMVLLAVQAQLTTLRKYAVGAAQRWSGTLEVAAWAREHLPPDAVIFTAGWTDAPVLFYGAPRQRYLVFLDPMFMYRHSPERFLRWKAIVLGQSAHPATEIWELFQAHTVFIGADPGHAALRAQLEATPGVTVVAAGQGGERLYLLSPP